MLLSLLSMVVFVKGQEEEENPFRNNEEFWEGLDDDEAPYEHDFTHIPDLIDNKTVYFWFN